MKACCQKVPPSLLWQHKRCDVDKSTQGSAGVMIWAAVGFNGPKSLSVNIEEGVKAKSHVDMDLLNDLPFYKGPVHHFQMGPSSHKTVRPRSESTKVEDHAKVVQAELKGFWEARTSGPFQCRVLTNELSHMVHHGEGCVCEATWLQRRLHSGPSDRRGKSWWGHNAALVSFFEDTSGGCGERQMRSN